MKRTLSLILALTLVLMVALPSAMAEDKVTLKILLAKNRLTKDVTEIQYLKDFADQANINIEWETHTSWTDEYAELRSIMIASGDLPDILLGDSSVLIGDLTQFPDLFLDLNTVLDKAPNIKRILEERPEIKGMATSDDGQILGMFQYLSRQPAISTRSMINKEWLDKLSLQIPTTWDELYDVLVAFKANDCNGNGEMDEIPMDWGPGVGYFTSLAMLGELGIPISLQNGMGFYVDDGVVKNYIVSEEYKTFLKFLQKCYAAGLINENVFTQDYTTFQNFSRAERVGFTFGWDILDRMGPEVSKKYVTVPPMKPTADYAGRTLWDNCFYSMNYRYPVGAISAASQHIDECVKFVDLLYAPANSIQLYWGTMGECVQDNGDGSYTVLPPADGTSDPGSWKWMNSLADNAPMFIPDDIKIDLPADSVEIRRIDKVYDEAIAAYRQSDMWPGPFLKYTADENAEMSLIRLDIENLFKNGFANWVIGGDIDAEWDAYVQNCYAAGLETATAINQRSYDAFRAGMGF